jgi:hypothetical protein
MRKLALISLVLALAWITGVVAVPNAEARSCISMIDLEECHPADGGEPPAWCGDAPWQRVTGWLGDKAEEVADAIQIRDIFWWLWR